MNEFVKQAQEKKTITAKNKRGKIKMREKK